MSPPPWLGVETMDGHIGDNLRADERHAEVKRVTDVVRGGDRANRREGRTCRATPLSVTAKYAQRPTGSCMHSGLKQRARGGHIAEVGGAAMVEVYGLDSEMNTICRRKYEEGCERWVRKKGLTVSGHEKASGSGSDP